MAPAVCGSAAGWLWAIAAVEADRSRNALRAYLMVL
jgi:hypothetical protein